MRERLKYRSVPLENATHYHYNFHCSTPGCRKFFTYKSKNVLPDEIVIQNAAREMKKYGWVPGRTQDSGVCPICVGVDTKNKIASVFKVFEGGKPVKGADEIAQVFGANRENQTKSVVKRIKNERKPEVEPEEHPSPVADLSPLIEELKANRVALELMFDQQTQMVGLMQQTIRAISLIVPHMTRGTETLVDQIRRVEEGLKNIPMTKAEVDLPVVFVPAPKRQRRKRNEG